MALEQAGGAVVAERFGGARVPPCGAIVAADGIDLREFHVSLGEGRIKPHRFEQEAQRVFLPPFDTVELRQVFVRARIGRLALDPGALLGDVTAGFLRESEIDYLFPPETHDFFLSRLMAALRSRSG